jgi:hypothetical protein
MNTDEHGYLDSLTERVLGAVFEVSNTLGAGFLEKICERTLLRECALRGIQATANLPGTKEAPKKRLRARLPSRQFVRNRRPDAE